MRPEHYATLTIVVNLPLVGLFLVSGVAAIALPFLSHSLPKWFGSEVVEPRSSADIYFETYPEPTYNQVVVWDDETGNLF